MEGNLALRSGTITGTVLSAVPNLLSDDIGRTVMLAVVGACVSFTVTLVLKALAGRKKKK